MQISIFGSASPKPGDPVYEQARELGFLLGKGGHTILTGGYAGTMEGASRGAAEAGAHVIGITCGELEALRGSHANSWVKEEWHYETLRERLYALVDHCDAAIALPGGVGTLNEICAFWNQLVITPAQRTRDLILVGGSWHQVIQTLFEEQGAYIHPADRTLVHFASDIHEAAELIHHASYSFNTISNQDDKHEQ